MVRYYKKCLSLVLSSILIISMFLYFPQTRAEAITVAQLQTAVDVLTKMSLLSQTQAQQAVAITQLVVNNADAGWDWLSAPEINNLKALGLTKAEVNAALNAVRLSVDNPTQWNLMKSGDYASVATLLNTVKTNIGSDTVAQLEAKGITVESLILASLQALTVQIYSWSDIPQSAINTIFDSNSPVQRATAELYGLNWNNVNTILSNLNATQKTELQGIIITVGSSSGAQQQVAAARTALTWVRLAGINASSSSVIANLILPAALTGISGVTISWVSNNPAVTVNGTVGTVTRPAAGAPDVNVNLTATLTKGFISDTKAFTVTVKAPPASVADTITNNNTAANTISTSNDSTTITNTASVVVTDVTAQISSGITEEAKNEIINNTLDTVFEELTNKLSAGTVTETAVKEQVNNLLQTTVDNVINNVTAGSVDMAATTVANILETVAATISTGNISGTLQSNLNTSVEKVMEKVNTVQCTSGTTVDLSSDIDKVVEKITLFEEKAGAKGASIPALTSEKKVTVNLSQTTDTEITLNANTVNQLTSKSMPIEIKNGDGATVKLPAALLASKVGNSTLKLKITKDTTQAPANVQNAGDAFDLNLTKGDGSSVTNFGGNNVSTTLPYTGSGSNLRVFYLDEATGQWVDLGVSVTRTGNNATFDAPHYTKFMIAEAKSSGGGGGGGGGGGATADNKVEATILAGTTTTATLTGKALVEIPSGAVTGANAKISMESVGDSRAEGATVPLLGPVVEIKLQNGSLASKIKITLYFNKYKLGENQAPVVYFNSGSQWTRAEGTVDYDRQTVTITVDHLTLFAVFAETKEAPKPGTAYKDVQGHWAGDTIGKLAGLGIISGYPDGTFKPENKISRAEVTAILVKALNLKPGTDSAIKFADEKSIPEWARQSVQAAVAAGILKGYPQPDGSITFEADKPVTRAELAAMTAYSINKKFGPTAPATLIFSDKDNIPAWATSAVETVVARGVVSGYPDNTFKAENPITRAEAASITLRLMELK